MGDPSDNVHGANRLLSRLIDVGKADELELVYPKHVKAVDRIFGTSHKIISTKKVSYHHSPDNARRAALVEAAQRVAGVARKQEAIVEQRKAVRSSTPKRTTSRKTNRQLLTELTKRVTKLEKNYAAGYSVVSEEHKLEDLVDLVDANAQELVSLRLAVDENFEKAEKVIARDERALGKLHKDVKTALKPQVKANAREIKSMKATLKRLEALYKTFQKSGSYDSVQLKQLGQRISVTKAQIEKFE